MSKFIRLTLKSTGLPLVMNANLIETMIPLDGYTSIRTTGMPFGEADHVLETIDQIEAQSLRDEFAKSALNGLLSNPGGVIQKSPLSGTHYINGNHESVTEWAYELADAMLKERSK